MKERPILMKDELVRATLEDLKAQTRRVVKPQPNPSDDDLVFGRIDYGPRPEGGIGFKSEHGVQVCPYGVPGDRLWVRETWAAHWMYNDVAPRDARSGHADDNYWFRADPDGTAGTHGCPADGRIGKWRPSIFMPRWASRIDMEVTAVRVERVQEITPEDAIAEGCGPIDGIRGGNPRAWFAGLWDAINAKPKPVYGRVDGKRVIIHATKEAKDRQG